MKSREHHTAFDSAHPAVPALYVVLTLGLTMFSFQPLLIAISLAGALAFCCCARGWRACVRALRWQVPLIVLVALVNPLFVASGSTELFRVGARAIYLESLCYGAAMGGLFVASVLWFQAAGALVSYDKVMALFGNAAPTIALMVSMSMRLIPRFVRQGKQIAGVQDVVFTGAATGSGATGAATGGSAAGAATGGGAPGAATGDSAAGAAAAAGAPDRAEAATGAADGAAVGGSAPVAAGAIAGAVSRRLEAMRARLRQSTVLMGWTMEDSLETADAMRARGWGAGNRTTYVRYRFTVLDGAALAGLAVAGFLCALLAYAATSRYAFYPAMSALAPWWGYGAYAAWMFLPAILHGCEAARWR